MKKAILLILLISGSINIIACLWDDDTIEMENQQFPNVINLISGNFLRHSEEYYEWKIKDREEKIKQFPDSLNYYDDLSVAYSKLHQDKKAIEVILKKEAIKPGLYETYANLGTFYIHDGNFDEGLKYIKKAIEINPNAHFGRERYQQLVVEYLIDMGYQKSKSLPIDTNDLRYRDHGPAPFYKYLVERVSDTTYSWRNRLDTEELKKATYGVLGMMKFGNYNSPVLLECLGDLLMNDGSENAARNLAARAYLAASTNAKNKDVKNKYFTIAKNILFIQRGIKFEDIHNNLSKELEKGQHYFQSIRENELKWIEAGIDVDSAFAETYYAKSTIEQKDVLEDVFKPTDAAHVDTTVTINQTDEKSYREESINYWVFFVIAFILVGIYVLIKYLLRKAK